MFNLEKKIPSILKEKKKFKNVLIIGGGNWARFHLNILLNSFFKLNKIFIFSKHNKKEISKSIKKFSANKVVKIVSSEKNLKNLSKNILIVNKTKFHYKFLKLFSNRKFNILVEKPICESIIDYKNIIDLTKNNKISFFVGFQRFYAVYFHHFKNFYIRNRKLKKIEFYWYDLKSEKSSSNEYLENILYHITSILFVFFHKKKMKILIFNKKYIKFLYGNCEIKVNFKRNYKKKIRIINFFFIKNKSSINWTNENKIIFFKKNKKSIFRPKFSIYNMQYQLYYFLNIKKKNSYKIPNNNKNLVYFFDFIKSIKKLKL